MNVKIKTEMHGQIISIEFRFSFPTIYHNDMYANGKVPPKIILLYGGISSYCSYTNAEPLKPNIATITQIRTVGLWP